MTTDFITDIIDRAFALNRYARLSSEFINGWSALEDTVLALSPVAQIDLFHAASHMIGKHSAAALILLSMIPDEVVEQAEA